MPLMKKSPDALRKAVEDAEATQAEWENKAAAVRADARELDANAGALILADETQAEKISIKIQSLERTARAYDGAAAEAKRKLHAAHRRRVETEAKEEDRLADQAQKRLDTHSKAVDSLLAQLKDLDECDYEPGQSTGDGYAATHGLKQVPKWYYMSQEVLKHRTRAAVIRYFLRTGTQPRDYYELNNELGTDFSGFGTSIAEQDDYPPIVSEYRDSAIEFERVGA